MISGVRSGKLDRRIIIKAAAAAGVAQLAAPFTITARAADEVRLGLNDPLTGTYAELGKNEQIGCQLAIEQINAKGGSSAARPSCWSRIRRAPIPALRSRKPAS